MFQTHTHTQTQMHARSHARTNARTHSHTHAHFPLDRIPWCPEELGLILSVFKALISPHVCSEHTYEHSHIDTCSHTNTHTLRAAWAGKLHPCHWHYLKPRCCVCAKLSCLGISEHENQRLSVCVSVLFVRSCMLRCVCMYVNILHECVGVGMCGHF